MTLGTLSDSVQPSNSLPEVVPEPTSEHVSVSAPKASEKDIRDEFAMHALQGLLSSQIAGIWTPPFANLADKCYGIADAMIAHRNTPL